MHKICSKLESKFTIGNKQTRELTNVFTNCNRSWWCSITSEVNKHWRTPCLDVIFEYKQKENRKLNN
jgi:hypothetical protein